MYFLGFMFANDIDCVIMHNPPKVSKKLISAHRLALDTYFSCEAEWHPFAISSMPTMQDLRKSIRNPISEKGFNSKSKSPACSITSVETIKNTIVPHIFRSELRPQVLSL